MEYTYKIALSYALTDEDTVKKVYHYLKAEGISVFFASAPECQIVLSGKNQREIFYEIFGIKAEYVALFVSSHYIGREVPMEEAGIAFAKHSANGSVIPIYMDDAILQEDMFNPKETNYFKSNNPIEIANHLATKIRAANVFQLDAEDDTKSGNIINIKNNKAKKQIFVHKLEGNINL